MHDMKISITGKTISQTNIGQALVPALVTLKWIQALDTGVMNH